MDPTTIQTKLTQANFFERNSTRLLAWIMILAWVALTLLRLPPGSIATLWGLAVVAIPPTLFMLVAASHSSKDRQAILDFLVGLRGKEGSQ
jgi:hypothetical protein